MGKKSSSAPDVKGAAATEGQYSRETARDANYANRPDQYNAFGSNTWGQESVRDPATGEMTTKWTQRQNLSPDQQRLFDQETERNTQLGNTANALGDRISSEIGTPLDWGQFGDVIAGPTGDGSANRQRAEDDAYGRSTQRLDPQYESERATLEAQMAGRGLRAGDSAYDSAMSNFSTGKNDAYEMARMGATAEGRTEDQQSFDQQMGANERANALREQQIQEYLAKRGQSLTESNALKDSQTMGDTAAIFSGGE
jgi:hypothetical protein